jgi:hypothetical protein
VAELWSLRGVVVVAPAFGSLELGVLLGVALGLAELCGVVEAAPAAAPWSLCGIAELPVAELLVDEAAEPVWLCVAAPVEFAVAPIWSLPVALV